MKKNLLSVLILALLAVNLILTAVMMVTSFSANRKVSKLVGDIAMAVDLQITADPEEAGPADVPMKDVVTYEINEMTIPLTIGEDGEEHFAIVSVTLSMNSKDKDYGTYGETLAERDGLIQSEITNAFSVRTVDEVRDPKVREELQQEILERIQEMFKSTFIFKASFKNIVYQ